MIQYLDIKNSITITKKTIVHSVQKKNDFAEMSKNLDRQI